MITADLAFSYGRELFAFPGRIDDNSSRGCNRLIQKQKASLITQAADLVDLLGWDKTTPTPQPTQGSLPFSANPENEHPFPPALLDPVRAGDGRVNPSLAGRTLQEPHLGSITMNGTSISSIEMPPCWKVFR